MLKASEVLMRAHNEGRKCGRSYFYSPNDRRQVRDIPGRMWGDLCALGFLIEPFKAEFDISITYTPHFVAEKYSLPASVINEIENRYEGWFEFGDKPQPLNVIAEWLEGIERELEAGEVVS